MAVPTVKIGELSERVQNAKSPVFKKVLEGVFNDFMSLSFGQETPYTTGKTVVPLGCTIQDVDNAIQDSEAEKKYKDIFVKISETFKSGVLTPQSKNGQGGFNWDPKLQPVLVFVVPNN